MQQLLKQFKDKAVTVRLILVSVILFSPTLAHAQSWGGLFLSVADSTLGALLSGLMQFIFVIVSRIVTIIGTILDVSVQYFVLDMAEKVNEIAAIESLWQTFRDLGNIAFIGVLLYIAIRTILDVGNSFNTKRLLIRLVIVALFVNFSLFATKVVIDTSNVVALQFYNSIQVEGCGEGEQCDLSHFFADAVSISSVQSSTPIEDGSGSNTNVALARGLGILFLTVAGFVMGAIALLLIIRFGVLILLMVASPLAFIAFILPGVGIGQKWIDELLSQSFFAPAVFAMIYVVARLAAGLKQGILSEGGDTDLMAVVANGTLEENVGIILVFIIMTILMMAALFVAKQIGAKGASKSIELGQKARNWGQATVVGASAGAAAWTGRQTIGRGAQRASESTRLKDAAKKGGAKGWAARRALNLSDKTAQKSFDARNTKAVNNASDVGQRQGGFREVIEDREKQRQQEKERIERLSPEEESKVQRASLKKEQADKSLEKKNKELDEQKKDIEENLSQWKDKFNSTQGTINNELNKVKDAIRDRERILNQLAEARDSGDSERVDELEAKLGGVTDNITGVSDPDNLEERRNALQTRQNNVQTAYNERKRELEGEKRRLRQSRKNAREATKKFKKKMDTVINIGNKRGEEFVEAMLDQQDMLDNMLNISPSRIAESGGSRGNRSFALDNVNDIKDKDTKKRVSQKLRDLS